MMLPNVFAMLQGGGAAAQGAEAQGEAPDVAGMLMHHLLDGSELEFQVFGVGPVIHLPQWEPIHIAGLTLDLSPTKHVFFLVLAAVLCLLVFICIACASLPTKRQCWMSLSPHIATHAYLCNCWSEESCRCW